MLSLPSLTLALADLVRVAVLKLSPNDEDALKCKAIVLIESSKFSEAIDLLKTDGLSSHFAFEQASFIGSCGSQFFSVQSY